MPKAKKTKAPKRKLAGPAPKKKGTKKTVNKKPKTVKGEKPTITSVEMPKALMTEDTKLVDFLVNEFYFEGTKQAKRGIKEGRVSVNGEVVLDTQKVLKANEEVMVQVERGEGSLI